MPLSCPIAPLSQRELHKDDSGGVGGVARRARAARAPKAKSCATSSTTPSKAPCAASLTCSSFTCRLGKAWGAVEHDACHDENLYASVLRATGGLVLPMRGSSADHDKAEDHKSERAFTREQHF